MNGPEPTWYSRVSARVPMVSQPPAVRTVNGVAPNESRPIALKVAASRKCASPAYSVRMSVGDSTSNRACPDTTARPAALRALLGEPCADCAVPLSPATARAAAARATTVRRDR